MALQPLTSNAGTDYDVYTGDNSSTLKRYSPTGTKQAESSNTYDVAAWGIVPKPRKTGIVIYDNNDGDLYSFDRNLNKVWSYNGNGPHAIDEDGNVYHASGTDVIKVDSDGNQVDSVTTSFAGTDIDELVISPRNKESAVYAQATTTNGSEVSKIDLDTMSENAHTTNPTGTSSGGLLYNYNGYLWDPDGNVLDTVDLSVVHNRNEDYGVGGDYQTWGLNNNVFTQDVGTNEDVLYDPFSDTIIETFGGYIGPEFVTSATGTLFTYKVSNWQTVGGVEFSSDDEIAVTGQHAGTHPDAYF